MTDPKLIAAMLRASAAQGSTSYPTAEIEAQAAALEAQQPVGDGVVDELELVAAVLRGYPDSIAKDDALRAICKINAALAAQPGVVLVPREATVAMKSAAIGVMYFGACTGEAAEIYRAMIAAAQGESDE